MKSRGDAGLNSKMSEYEQRAIREIREWKKPKASIFDAPLALLTSAADVITETAKRIPGVESGAQRLKGGTEWAAQQIKPVADLVIEKAIGGLVATLNDWALATVRPGAIAAEFAKSGLTVNRPEDVRTLDLEKVDRAIGWLAAKYKGVAVAEGGATGAVGMVGIPANIVLLVGMCQRAIGEYATYAGFDVASQRERLFAMNILGLASSASDAGKVVAMSQLVLISKQAARRAAWKELESAAFVRIVKRVATALGIRLTKAKLVQAIPPIGGVIGAGFDAYFIDKVCDTAYMLYRERFLAQKYGPDVIAEVVAPAKSYEPQY